MYIGFQLSERKIISVKAYQHLYQTRTLILRWFSCKSQEGPNISLQGVKITFQYLFTKKWPLLHVMNRCYLCMAYKYHTKASHLLVHTLHVRAVVRKRNTLTLPSVTYAYCLRNILLRLRTTIRICNTFVTYSYVWHMHTHTASKGAHVNCKNCSPGIKLN